MVLTALLLAGLSPPRGYDEDDDRDRRTERVHQTNPAAGKVHAAGSDKDDVDGPKPKTPQAAAGPTPEAMRGDDDDQPRAAQGQAAAQPGQGHVNGDDAEEEEGRAQPDTEVVVTARRLDAARTLVDVGLGATVTTLSNDAVENRPGGETGSIAAVLQQVPGAVLSGRSLTVRGSSANQVRINNVIVPEAISDPADLISSRLAETTRLITGTLPAQFGFAPASVISITTKTGLYQHSGQAELFAGTDGSIEPALEWAGSAGRSSLFASASVERRRTRVANAAGALTRERGLALEGLGFADRVIDGENRVSLILGGSHEQHRFGVSSVGAGEQRSGSSFGVATFQHSGGGFTLQASLLGGLEDEKAAFLRSTQERRVTWGNQVDGSAKIGTDHVLRFGLLATRSTSRQSRSSAVRRTARTALGLYAQDECRWAGE